MELMNHTDNFRAAATGSNRRPRRVAHMFQPLFPSTVGGQPEHAALAVVLLSNLRRPWELSREPVAETRLELFLMQLQVLLRQAGIFWALYRRHREVSARAGFELNIPYHATEEL